ncbi:MAG: glutamate--tRNA ligase, partial [Thaumarchaeota archaeon]|nr:glutamate--tRNA ligase [Nitrososphaerota archaeon]
AEPLETIRKHTLHNAYKHNGKADTGAVAGKIAAEMPDFRAQLKTLMPQIKRIVEEVNQMSSAEQLDSLKRNYPDMLTAESPREEVKQLPPLPEAEKGKVVLRLPPEPSGYMHIGHAVAGLINYLYTQMYDGALWLRFEDTNPRNAVKEYYESFRDGYRWLGIRWNHEKNVSDDLEVIYKHSRRLIEQGYLYACTCSPETVKKNRVDGVPCACRRSTTSESLGVWEAMFSGAKREGEASIRFKGDMSSLDTSLRDPALLRIVEHPHPIHGSKYRVWPNYDLAVVVEDYLCTVSHVLRSMEFHVDLQDILRRLLGFPDVKIIQFSRVKFEGTPLSKRLLRPLVQEGLVEGWDDPRMPTIAGVRRKGVVPEALLGFTKEVGYTKAEHVFDWDLIYAVNRKILDPVAKRYFFVPNPVRVKVADAPSLTVKIRFHPDKDLGEREMASNGVFYLAGDDVARVRVGDVFRLIDLYNVKVEAKSGKKVSLSYTGRELVREMLKLQWVTEENTGFRVRVPGPLYVGESFNRESMMEIQGLAEKEAATLKPGEIVQFPRFGFCRIDAPNLAIFAHK